MPPTFRRHPYLMVAAVIGIVILIDQSIKIWVKTNMLYGEEFFVFGLPWFRIHFVENEGMAYGIQLGGKFGKLLLTLFRYVAVGLLLWMLHHFIRKKYPMGMLFFFALIIGGAIGNLIDSTFYGLIFNHSTYHGPAAELFPKEGGYAGLFYGKVVDMFYFPLIDTRLPEWIPFIGGNRFRFFEPVFNFADTCITTGVIGLLLFYRRYLFYK